MGYLTIDDIKALKKGGLRAESADSNIDDPEKEHALFFSLRKKYDNARKMKAAGILFNDSRRQSRSSEHVNLLFARDGMEPALEGEDGVSTKEPGYSDSVESTARDSSPESSSVTNSKREVSENERIV